LTTKEVNHGTSTTKHIPWLSKTPQQQEESMSEKTLQDELLETLTSLGERANAEAERLEKEIAETVLSLVPEGDDELREGFVFLLHLAMLSQHIPDDILVSLAETNPMLVASVAFDKGNDAWGKELIDSREIPSLKAGYLAVELKDWEQAMDLFERGGFTHLAAMVAFGNEDWEKVIPLAKRSGLLMSYAIAAAKELGRDDEAQQLEDLSARAMEQLKDKMDALASIPQITVVKVTVAPPIPPKDDEVTEEEVPE
jgi:hypothetical protein